MSKYYQLRFDSKVGHVICAIRRIPCACVACTPMIDKPWISVIPSKKQSRYQPFTICTYCPVLGSCNNWNIIEITPKSTPFEVFDEIHQVVLYRINHNMASLFQSGICGATSTDDTKTNGFYVI